MQDKFRFPCRSVFALWLLALFALARPTHAQAVLNPNGGSATGTLTATQTVVTYSYTAAKDEDATLTLTNSGGLRAYVQLYDSDNSNQIGSTFVDSGATGTLGIGHLAPGATYFVHIALYSGSGTFTVSSAVTPPVAANDIEPNNDPAHAHAYATGATTTGHLGYSRTAYGDVDTQDWYTFTVPKDGDVTFTLTTDSVFPLRAYVQFYDVDGTSQVGSTFVDVNSSGQLGVGHLAPGTTYYVLIQRYNGYGGYTLKNSEALPVIATQAAPTNTPATALPFAPNSTVTGHVGYSFGSYSAVSAQVWYSFIAPQDGDATFTLTTDGVFPLRAYVQFYDVDGSSQYGSAFVDVNSSGQLGVGHLAPGAKYYVLVQRYDGYGGYTLKNTLTPPAVAIDAEPNNDYQHAHISANSALTGHLGYSRTSYGDIDTNDWYTFVAPADEDVTFTLTTDTTFPLRASVYFYDSDGGSQIGSSGVVAANASGQLTVGHLAPGATYYVLVQRYDGYGGYTLTNSTAAPAFANDKEVNDAPTTALFLPTTGSRTGHLGYSRTSYGDIDSNDWYTFTATQNGDATFTLTTDGVFPLRASAYFFDSDGSSQIGSSGVVAANASGQLTVGHLAPGATYYVLVQRYDGYGGYRIASTFAPVTTAIKPIPGTTPGTAATFAPNSTVTGNLGYSQSSYSSVSANAWYSFVAPRDGDATFTLTTDIKLPLRAIAYFFDSDSSSQIGNTGVIAAQSSGQLTIGHLAPGAKYYVLVQRYDGYGGYTLNNTYAPLFVANDAENNDTSAQAVTLANLVNVTGHLGYSRTAYSDQDNTDWYKIALPTGTFQANISLSGSLRSILYLFAPDGSSQLTNSGVVGSGGSGQISYTIQTAGTYYLAVSRYDGYGGYDINQPVTATVYGTVTLEQIAPSAPAQTINVEFRPQPSGDGVHPANRRRLQRRVFHSERAARGVQSGVQGRQVAAKSHSRH